jgi:TonB family protein
MTPRNLFERSSVFLNVSILPLLLICGDDPNPQHRPAAPVIKLPQPDARAKPLYEPAPKYRFEARQKHWEGTGLIELTITQDGIVTGVTVLQSTGHTLLDRDAAGALRVVGDLSRAAMWIECASRLRSVCIAARERPNQSPEPTTGRRDAHI